MEILDWLILYLSMQKYINYTVSRKVVMEHRHSREMISFYYKSNKQLVCKQSHNISWKGMQKWPRDYLQALAAQVMSAFVFIFSVFWRLVRDTTVETENQPFTSLSGQAFPWRPLCHSCPHPSWASESASSSAGNVACVDSGLPCCAHGQAMSPCMSALCAHFHVWSPQRPVSHSLSLTPVPRVRCARRNVPSSHAAASSSPPVKYYSHPLPALWLLQDNY